MNRTNYSKLKPILVGLQSIEEIDLRIVASSSVLLAKYGNGIDVIKSDGFLIDREIDCSLMNDSHEAMAKTLGNSVTEHATYYAQTKPDVLLVVGDRFDMLGAVIPAMLMNIPIIHIQGGEESGSVDDTVRNIISTVAIAHLVATKRASQNLKNIGVNEAQIYHVGCPSVDYLSNLDLRFQNLNSEINENFKKTIELRESEPYLLVIFHPDTITEEKIDVPNLIQSLLRLNTKIFLFYPNIDANNSKYVQELAHFKHEENLIFVKNMRLESFANLMAHAACMIGNSSAGIREAASFGTPVVNIGNRQEDRERNKNTIDIDSNCENIETLVKKLMNKRFPRENIYHLPETTARSIDIIVATLETIKK